MYTNVKTVQKSKEMTTNNDGIVYGSYLDVDYYTV